MFVNEDSDDATVASQKSLLSRGSMMSRGSQFSRQSKQEERITALPLLPPATSSAYRKSLLRKEFQMNFGRNGSRVRVYSKALNQNKSKPKIKLKHESRALEYDALDRWLKKRNIVNSNASRVFSLSKREIELFFKWFEAKMKKHSDEDGLNIGFVIDDFLKSGLFKTRAEASHFIKVIDTDKNGFISCEEFSEGVLGQHNLHQVMEFKRFIKKLRGDGVLSSTLPPTLTSKTSAKVESNIRPSTVSGSCRHMYAVRVTSHSL